jgi:hypothetical protein
VKYILTAVSMMLLILTAVAAVGQSSNPKPAPALKQWDIWIGDWDFSGTAKDTQTGPEYKFDWHMHGRWILNGFSGQIDSVIKGNGVETRSLEILSYDPIKKIHTVSGFQNDGLTWSTTFTFDKETSVENVRMVSPDGKVVTCRNTFVFSSDRMAVSGAAECDDGSSWRVKGTKSKTAG